MPREVLRRHAGIVVHRRAAFEVTTHDGIPVTTPVSTLIDVAATLSRESLESAVNEADSLDLVNPEQLRAALDGIGPRPGLAALRRMLDRLTSSPTPNSSGSSCRWPARRACRGRRPESG